MIPAADISFIWARCSCTNAHAFGEVEPNLVAGAADLLSNVLAPNAVRALYQHCMQQVTHSATSLVALGEFDRSVEKRRAERANLQLAASPDGIADALLRRLQDSSAAGHLHDAGQPRRGTLNLEGGRSTLSSRLSSLTQSLASLHPRASESMETATTLLQCESGQISPSGLPRSVEAGQGSSQVLSPLSSGQCASCVSTPALPAAVATPSAPFSLFQQRVIRLKELWTITFEGVSAPTGVSGLLEPLEDQARRLMGYSAPAAVCLSDRIDALLTAYV